MCNDAGLPQLGCRKLIAWQKAMDFADRVCLVCDSIPSNIAEGHGRQTQQFLGYLRIAKVSLQEAATQLELLLRRGAAKTETLLQLLRDADELAKIIFGLMRGH
jgi:four helix bundle protein